MKNELYSISKIFTERLLRIPDYQRGYAWTERQLKDYWIDIDQLEVGNNHYFGVLTLETVDKKKYNKWDDDLWIIESKSYEPNYVVDGQQRLTTTIILIQAIIESLDENKKLNYTSAEDIRKKFIFESKDNGISRSYIFGYEVDNPSYEFLKQSIFNEISENQGIIQETIYTHNLIKAKNFFQEKLKNLTFEQKEILYKKITQHLLFNIYSMSEDIDVHVSFETMNNRGKPLSHLELLKNRLIYLSTKINADNSEKDKLRKSINECWKTIYHQLGKNKDNPLDDDVFLYNHFMLFFADEIKEKLDADDYRWIFRGYRNDYREYLLEDKFTIKSISKDEKNHNLDLKNIYNYVSSLKVSVEIWFEIFNPDFSKRSDDIRSYLKKLNRIGNQSVLSLIMVSLQKEKDDAKLSKFLSHLETLIFAIKFLDSPYEYSRQDVVFVDLAFKISHDKVDLDKAILELNRFKNEFAYQKVLVNHLTGQIRYNGFYNWRHIRYFLYEYEEHLRITSKQSRHKLYWDKWMEDANDYTSVEHIYPQNPRHDYWKSRFNKYNDKERTILRHTIGNLVPVSNPKNSSLKNKPFIEKIGDDKNSIGYKYGSYSEIELTNSMEWTAKEILIRSVKLIKFISKRWKLNFGNTEDIVKFLKLEFVLEKENLVIINDRIEEKNSKKTP